MFNKNKSSKIPMKWLALIILFILYLVHEFDKNFFDFIAAISPIALSLIFFYFQFEQSLRIERFEKKQDKRDEDRYAELVKSKALSFITKYHEEKGLIPLCAMAAMYNDIYHYSKEMYREFCCLTTETQNCILKYLELDIQVKKEENIYEKCIEILEEETKKNFPNDDAIPFYDNGKYIRYGLEYGKEKVPLEEINYKYGTAPYDACITDVLSDYLQKRSEIDKPIKYLKDFYDFYNTEGIKACQFCMTLAQYISAYVGMKYNSNARYGEPGRDGCGIIVTMEDLFLLCLYEIYTNLILRRENQNKDNIKEQAEL